MDKWYKEYQRLLSVLQDADALYLDAYNRAFSPEGTDKDDDDMDEAEARLEVARKAVSFHIRPPRFR